MGVMPNQNDPVQDLVIGGQRLSLPTTPAPLDQPMIGAAPTPPRPTQFELDEQRKRDEERQRIRAAAEKRLQEESEQRQAARDAERLRRETMTEDEYYADRVTSRLPGTRDEQLRMIGTMRPGQFQALHTQARLESDSFSAAETALARIIVGTYNNYFDLLSNAAEFYIKGIFGTPGLLDDTTVEEAIAFGNGFDRIAARLREGRRVQNERLGDLFSNELRREGVTGKQGEDVPFYDPLVLIENLGNLAFDLPTWIYAFPIRGNAEVTRTYNNALDEGMSRQDATVLATVEIAVLFAIPKVLGGGAQRQASDESIRLLMRETVKSERAVISKAFGEALKRGDRSAMRRHGGEIIKGAAGMLGIELTSAAAEEVWVESFSQIAADSYDFTDDAFVEGVWSRMGGAEGVSQTMMFGGAFRSHANAKARAQAREQRRTTVQQLHELSERAYRGEISFDQMQQQRFEILEQAGDFAAATFRAVEAAESLDRMSVPQLREFLNRRIEKLKSMEESGEIADSVLEQKRQIRFVMEMIAKKGGVVTIEGGEALGPAPSMFGAGHLYPYNLHRPLFMPDSFEGGAFGRSEPGRESTRGRPHGEYHPDIIRLAERFEGEMIRPDGSLKAFDPNSGIEAERLLEDFKVETTETRPERIERVTGLDAVDAQIAMDMVMRAREEAGGLGSVRTQLEARATERGASLLGEKIQQRNEKGETIEVDPRPMVELQAESVSSLDTTLDLLRNRLGGMAPELQAEARVLLEQGIEGTSFAESPLSGPRRGTSKKVIEEVGDILPEATRQAIEAEQALPTTRPKDFAVETTDNRLMAGASERLDTLTARLRDIVNRDIADKSARQITRNVQRVLEENRAIGEAETAVGMGVLREVQDQHSPGFIVDGKTTFGQVAERAFELARVPTGDVTPLLGSRQWFDRYVAVHMRPETRALILSGGANTEAYRILWYDIKRANDSMIENRQNMQESMARNSAETGVERAGEKYTDAKQVNFKIDGIALSASETVTLHATLRDPDTLRTYWGKRVSVASGREFVLNESTYRQLHDNMGQIQQSLGVDAFGRSEHLMWQANNSGIAVNMRNYLYTVEGRGSRGTTHGLFFPRSARVDRPLELSDAFRQSGLTETGRLFEGQRRPDESPDVLGLRSETVSSDTRLRVLSEQGFVRQMQMQNAISTVGVPLNRARNLLDGGFRDAALRGQGTQALLDGYQKNMFGSFLDQAMGRSQPKHTQFIGDLSVSRLGGAMTVYINQTTSADLFAARMPEGYRVGARQVLQESLGRGFVEGIRGIGAVMFDIATFYRFDLSGRLQTREVVPRDVRDLHDAVTEISPLYRDRQDSLGKALAEGLSASELADATRESARVSALMRGMHFFDINTVLRAGARPVAEMTCDQVATEIMIQRGGEHGGMRAKNDMGMDYAPEIVRNLDAICEAAGITRQQAETMPEPMLRQVLRQNMTEVIRVEGVRDLFRDQFDALLPTQPIYDPLHRTGLARERRDNPLVGGMLMFRGFRDSATDQQIRQSAVGAMAKRGEYDARGKKLEARQEKLIQQKVVELQALLFELSEFLGAEAGNKAKAEKIREVLKAEAELQVLREQSFEVREGREQSDRNARLRMNGAQVKASMLYNFVKLIAGGALDDVVFDGKGREFVYELLMNSALSLIGQPAGTELITEAGKATTGSSVLEQQVGRIASEVKDIPEAEGVIDTTKEVGDLAIELLPFARLQKGGAGGAVMYGAVKAGEDVYNYFEQIFEEERTNFVPIYEIPGD